MTVRLAPGTKVYQHGLLLVGGSPLTAQRLRRPVTQAPADSVLGRRWLATGLGVPDLDDVPPVRADEITVVVPAHGRADLLARCVAALAPLDVVVVDDASDPPLPAATVRLAQNGGPATARNAGLARVTTPYVAFVDSDVETTAADLLALARHLTDPDVALVGPRVRGRSATEGAARWWERYDAAFSALDLGPHAAAVRPGSRVAYLPSACLVARRTAIGDGFDADLRVGEDVDLVWRLVADGHRVRYDPSVVVHHATRPTLGALLRQHLDYGTSAAPLAERHGRAVAPAVLRPVLGAAGVAALAHRWWSTPVVVAAWALVTCRLARGLPPVAAARLAGSGVDSAVRQESSLVLRPWWPLAALAALTPTGRRLVRAALVVDGAVALADRRGVDPLTRVAGRRLVDLAYGLGVWRGCVRARSVAALLPRRSVG